jgi:hypothetical protein
MKTAKLEIIQKQINHHQHELTTLGHTIGYKGIREKMQYHTNKLAFFKHALSVQTSK